MLTDLELDTAATFSSDSASCVCAKSIVRGDRHLARLKLITAVSALAASHSGPCAL